MKWWKSVLFGLTIGLLPALWSCAQLPYDYWFEDSLVKVFPDSPPPGSGDSHQAVLATARNGHSSIQMVLRARQSIAGFSIDISGPADAPIQLSIRRVGTVSVKKNTPESPAEEWVRKAPGEFPDPLFSALPATLEPGRSQAFWITAFTPSTTTPGTYTAQVRVRINGREDVFPFTIEVMAATVPPEQQLKVTNWFNVDRQELGRHFNLPDEAAYWNLLSAIGKVMAEHRQNVMITPVGDLVKVEYSKGGYQFDFSEFDRWVDTFTEAGLLGTIEGGHLLMRPTGYFSPVRVPSWVVEKGQLVRAQLAPDDPAAERYLKAFLKALYAHLGEKNLRNRYLQHLHDEPHGDEIPIYEKYAQLVKSEMPGIPMVDAVDLKENNGFLDRNLDIWVPVLSSFDNRLDVLEGHRKSGGRNWFYTCIVPQGKYLNRFIDYSLLKVRLLHWFNFRYDFTGFLHWGGNYWSDDPFGNVEPVINDGKTLLPPGDNALVYPDPEHTSILSSIRLESMMEGIEDYELLTALAAKNPTLAGELAKSAIPGMTDYVRDPAQFRKLQRRLLEALSE